MSAAGEMPGEQELLARLRAGDEDAFMTLVELHHTSLRRLARGFVRSDALAEEVAQETWEVLLTGLDRFEARSSIKTWLFRVLVNRARTRAVKEARSVPMSALEDDDGGPSVDPARFKPSGHWATPPEPWDTHDPETLLMNEELGRALVVALDCLPERQRLVVLLRDVEGWTSDEVCNILELAETNQRVLLHRGRARLRQALEDLPR